MDQGSAVYTENVVLLEGREGGGGTVVDFLSTVGGGSDFFPE